MRADKALTFHLVSLTLSLVERITNPEYYLIQGPTFERELRGRDALNSVCRRDPDSLGFLV